MTEIIIFISAGVILGFIAGFFTAKYRLQAGFIKLQERNSILETNAEHTVKESEEQRSKIIELNSELSAVKAEYRILQQKLTEQKNEVEELQRRFTAEFENLANRIFDEKTRRFTEQSRTNLDSLLVPLGERIKDFEKRVNDLYVDETRQRTVLTEQLKQLQDLNKQMSEEANNLTRALKGDKKSQGTWGEFILESILEKSGLEKGREFVVQESVKDQDGTRLRPDVIIKLPENRNMIIDSKVSLIAYEKYCSAEDEALRKGYINEHFQSVRNHIKNLGSKNYQALYSLANLDFVLMFIPIEPAFGLAVQSDANLFSEAFEKNIVIVSPSTLLATLRTIANLWKQEKQSKHALEIARQSGMLYDKLESFLKDLLNVGDSLRRTQSSYDDALRKLSTGSGNIINRAQKIKELGAETTKSLPQSLVDRAEDGGRQKLADTESKSADETLT